MKFRDLFITEGDSATTSEPDIAIRHSLCPDCTYLIPTTPGLVFNSILMHMLYEKPWAIKEGERRVALKYADKYAVEGIL